MRYHDTKEFPARAKVKYGAGGRCDARLSHIITEVAFEWYKGRPIHLNARWLCKGYASRVRLYSEPPEELPLCPTCGWKDAQGGPFVYFAERDGRIKIGFSTAPGQRAHSLHSDLLAFMPGDLATERAMHHRFAEDRIAGEWFRPSPALRSFIAELQEQAA